MRIPLADFGLPRGSRVRGARLTFNRAAIGTIYLGNVRFNTGAGREDAGGPGPIPGPFLGQETRPRPRRRPQPLPCACRRPG